MAWFSVKERTSTTRCEEIKRRKCHQTEGLNPSPSNTLPEKSNQEQTTAALMELLRHRGNCFFRAVARMVYADDDYHFMVRRQAIERIQDYPEDYADFSLKICPWDNT